MLMAVWFIFFIFIRVNGQTEISVFCVFYV